MLPLTLVVIISYSIANYLKIQPIYESLLKDILGGKNEFETDSGEKIIIEFIIKHNHRFENKRIKDIKLPKDVLIVSIKKGEKTTIPNGDTILETNDLIMCFLNKKNEVVVRKELSK